MNLINTGETAMVSLPTNYPSDQIPSISGSAFFANYRFVQLHFHWGPNSIDGGSEHLLRSKRYAAEMHLVHYNTKYNSFAEATKYADGLAVVGVFLDTNNNPNDNAGLEKIVSHLSEIRESGGETTLTSPLKLSELLPRNTKLFYRYFGSLTTPNYNEIVTWTVFKTPLFVSERQVIFYFNQSILTNCKINVMLYRSLLFEPYSITTASQFNITIVTCKQQTAESSGSTGGRIRGLFWAEQKV